MSQFNQPGLFDELMKAMDEKALVRRGVPMGQQIIPWLDPQLRPKRKDLDRRRRDRKQRQKGLSGSAPARLRGTAGVPSKSNPTPMINNAPKTAGVNKPKSSGSKRWVNIGTPKKGRGGAKPFIEGAAPETTFRGQGGGGGGNTPPKDAPDTPKGGKFMKGLSRMMGPFFVGMIANDILKQLLGQTEGARQEKMGQFMAGEEALGMLGTPDDLTTRRELASLMEGLADYEGARRNPIYDRIL